MKAPGFEWSSERREREPLLVGKITIMRHGDTEYGEEYPGISELGAEQMRENARDMLERGRLAPDDDITFWVTPAVRTHGSMDALTDELGHGEVEKRTALPLRPVDTPDPEKSWEIHKEYRGEGTMHDWENKWASDDVFNEMPEIFEPRDNINKRSALKLTSAIKAMRKYHVNPEHKGKVPHAIAVAHIEVLYKFVCDVFQMDPATDPLIRYGERIDIDIMDLSNEEDPLLRVRFREKEATVRFNMTSRTVIV